MKSTTNRIPTTTTRNKNKTEVEKKNKNHIKNTSPATAASFSSSPSKHRTNDYEEHKQKPSENRIKKMSTMNVVSTTSEAPRSEKLAQAHQHQQHPKRKGISDRDRNRERDDYHNDHDHHNELEENLPERENVRLVSLGPYSHLDSNNIRTPPPSRRKSPAYYIKPPPPRVPPKPLNSTKSFENFEIESHHQYDPVVFREKIENFERNFSAHSYDGSGRDGFKVLNGSTNISTNNSTVNHRNNNLILTSKKTVSVSLPLVNGGGSQRILRYDSFGRRKDVIVTGDEQTTQNGITSAKNNQVNNFKNSFKNQISKNCENQRSVSLSAKELNSSMLINDIDKNIYSLSEENIYNNNNNNNNSNNKNNNCEVSSGCSDEVIECNCGVNSHKSLEGLYSNPIRALEAVEVEVSFSFFFY